MARISARGVLSIVETLETEYGVARYRVRFDPMEELVSCILSQHTADRNSFPAFTHLRATYETWGNLVEAGAARLAETIQAAGLANQKARNILGCLSAIHSWFGDYTLEPLRAMTTSEAMELLLGLPGVGPKTASLVLCFSFGRETIPVDTHVFRVSKRLGLISEEITEAKAHEELLKLVPEGFAFRFHAALIQHGRNICTAPSPHCDRCIVRDRCPWFVNSKGKSEMAKGKANKLVRSDR
jgi:endonuclease-3